MTTHTSIIKQKQIDEHVNTIGKWIRDVDGQNGRGYGLPKFLPKNESLPKSLPKKKSLPKSLPKKKNNFFGPKLPKFLLFLK